ncbi:MAG: PH domain-containing protein [Actinomycetia bacterium]|nr:PH domain-containing protein [Actinomycetes bacterium]
MENLELRPEKEQRTLWLITWAVIFIIGTPVWIMLPVLVGENIFLFVSFLIIWLIVMIPIVFWIPAAFRALEYTIDSDGVKMKGGVVWKKHVTVPYSKITNVDITRGPLQRHYNIGTIHVQTAGAGGQQGTKAELKLSGIRELDKVREVIIENIKDLNFPAGDRKIIKTETSAGEGPVFKDILNELKGIRDILKNRDIR